MVIEKLSWLPVYVIGGHIVVVVVFVAESNIVADTSKCYWLD